MRCLWCVAYILLVILLLAGLAVQFLVDIEDSSSVSLLNLHPSQDIVGSTFDVAKNRYHTVRQRTPFTSLDVAHDTNVIQNLLQFKEFMWVSFSGKQWYVAVALLEFRYVGACVVNVFNVATNDSWATKFEIPFASLLGFGPTFYPSPRGFYSPFADSHKIEFREPIVTGTSASIVASGKDVTVDFSGPLRHRNGTRVATTLRFKATLGTEAMNLVFPFGPRRASMVVKTSGADAAALTLRLGQVDFTHTCAGVTAGFDYTRGLLRRNTTWFWASASFTTFGTRIGFHLSSIVYDVNNISAESTVFINDKPHFLDSRVYFAKVTSAPEPINTKWTVVAQDTVSLTFTPVDQHHGKLFPWPVLHGDMFHMWGTFDGWIRAGTRRYELKGVVGVLEDHNAVW